MTKIKFNIFSLTRPLLRVKNKNILINKTIVNKLNNGEYKWDNLLTSSKLNESHGAARFTRGRMYDASDKYSVYVCRKCGLIASHNDKMHIHLCHTCGNRADFAYVEIPYACKLIFQELNTMNIAPRLITEG